MKLLKRRIVLSENWLGQEYGCFNSLSYHFNLTSERFVNMLHSCPFCQWRDCGEREPLDLLIGLEQEVVVEDDVYLPCIPWPSAHADFILDVNEELDIGA